MDFNKYRDYPVVGNLFMKPQRGTFAWIFFGFSLLIAGWMFVDRGPKVSFLVGGGLILLSVPNVLPEKYYRASVVIRVFGILYYILLWGAIFIFFPDGSTFFEGNW